MPDSTCGREHQQCKEHLTGIANILLRDTVPEEIMPLLYEASLFAFGEKDGGVRPITVGFTIRRMVAKIVSNRTRHLNDMFRPIQLGFATLRGFEAAVHAVRSFIKSNVLQKSPRVIIKLDVRNAFYIVGMQCLFEAV